MSRIGLISNPGSQQNRRGLAGIAAAAERAGLAHRVLGDIEDLLPALEELAAEEVEILVINGGDGTLQASLTHLLEARPFAALPRLAVLPRGMTNMSALDVGLTGRPERALAKLAELARDPAQEAFAQNTVSRAVLRLENIAEVPPQRGMFFGAGGITNAIEYCRAKVHPWRIEADWAAGLTLAGVFASWLLRGGRSSVIKAQHVRARLDEAPETSADLLLLLATTLDRLVLKSRPFWDQAGEPLRYTAIAYPPKRLLRSAPRVLYGGNERDLPAPDYSSRGAHRLELRFDGRFTLDGQMYDASADQPLVISAPDQVDFVRVESGSRPD